jgi:hypothetical protein
MTPAAGDTPRWWVVRSRANGTWTTRVLFGTLRSTTLDLTSDRVLLTSVDQAGNTSPSASWQAP